MPALSLRGAGLCSADAARSSRLSHSGHLRLRAGILPFPLRPPFGSVRTYCGNIPVSRYDVVSYTLDYEFDGDEFTLR